MSRPWTYSEINPSLTGCFIIVLYSQRLIKEEWEAQQKKEQEEKEQKQKEKRDREVKRALGG